MAASGHGFPDISFKGLLLDFLLLTHFKPMLPFYPTRKHQETSSFLMFSGGMLKELWLKMN